MLGAGSMFTPKLVRDVLLIEGNQGGRIALVDVDEDRLQRMHRLIVRMLDELGEGSWTVVASTDRAEVMAGSDYLVCCIEVSGVECVKFDNDIPLEYGVDQCIGDTIGPGGLFKALRTVPVYLDVLRDVRRLCPGAWMLNYTNPMSIMCLAAGRAVPEVQTVGLCHSVQGTTSMLAERVGVPIEEVVFECAGINHLAWVTRFERDGVDLYSELKRGAAEDVEAAIGALASGNGAVLPVTAGEGGDSDLVRKEMLLQFGAYITESSGHLSEYLPYFRKNEDGRRLLRDGYHGGSRFYADNWPAWRRGADDERDRLISGENPLDWKRSWEYGSWIIEAREKNTPWKIYGNVMNRDVSGRGELITNLPADGCVEVACMVDGAGIHPTRYGALPRSMAPPS
ncbi:MAG: alpha-glucosidase/alpha-galactosidase, partial [Planctomycetota bacterium]